MANADPTPDPSLNLELTTQPHDAYLKRVFSDPALAARFFQDHLPAGLTSRMDWSTLATLPGSFVKRSLQQAHSDLLFQMTSLGQPVLLYLLLEHQTKVDRTMPLRLLAYVTGIWLNHPGTGSGSLPPILPFVLHQGPAEWQVSTGFASRFDLAPPLAALLQPYLPSFRHRLLDLSQADPSGEENDPTLRVVLQLMKVARQRKKCWSFSNGSPPSFCRCRKPCCTTVSFTRCTPMSNLTSKA
jgi:hypothetical protein